MLPFSKDDWIPTVDGNNPASPWMYKKPCKNGINYQPQLVNARFPPSTVGIVTQESPLVSNNNDWH